MDVHTSTAAMTASQRLHAMQRVCILGAAPFAALGFVKYNGMTAEKFIWAWIKSEFLMPKKLVFHSTNTYYELMKPTIEQKQKIKKEN